MAAPLHEDGLRRVVNEKASTRNVERTLPPVSLASGGWRPGIDLDDSAALQAADCPLDELRQSAERPAIDELRALGNPPRDGAVGPTRCAPSATGLDGR